MINHLPIPNGFGLARSPRIWLQAIYKDGSEKFLRFDGCDRNIQPRCISLLKNPRIDYICAIKHCPGAVNCAADCCTIAVHKKPLNNGRLLDGFLRPELDIPFLKVHNIEAVNRASK